MNSETITQRIWQHSKATGSNKLMLLALAQFADVDGFCWPGYEALGAMVGLTDKADSMKRKAMRNLAPVIESGEVMVWEQQGQHGGRGYTNIYLITVGLTGDQIREIVQRRFELKGDEIDTVLSKKGDKYVTLCYLKRVTIETLLRTREAIKGDKNDTRTIEESNPIESIIDNPITSNSNELEGGKPPAEPKKPKPIKEPKEQTPIPAAIKVYQSIARRLPDKAIWPEIENKVGTAPECLERWGKVITAYIGCGWNKLNLVGMLRFYEENRIPSTEPIGRNGAYQNGQHSKPNQKARGATGESLDDQPVYDIYTDEYLYPDGHREPAN